MVYVALPGWEMSAIFLPQVIVGFGNGLLLPTSIAGAVSIRPQVAGTASGVTGFIQMAIGAAAAQLGGHAIAHATGAMPMLLLMLAFGVATGAPFWALAERELSRGDPLGPRSIASRPPCARPSDHHFDLALTAPCRWGYSRNGATPCGVWTDLII